VLKKIIKKLYEDFASDLLDSDGYHSMLTEYMQEQKKITTRLSVIENELIRKDSHAQNVQKLKAVLDEWIVQN